MEIEKLFRLGISLATLWNVTYPIHQTTSTYEDFYMKIANAWSHNIVLMKRDMNQGFVGFVLDIQGRIHPATLVLKLSGTTEWISRPWKNVV